MTNEYTSVVTKIMNWINSMECGKVINVQGSVYSEKGTPDVIGCVKGRFVAFECKKFDGKPSKIQEFRIKQWQKCGGIAGFAYSLDEAKDLLHKHIK